MEGADPNGWIAGEPLDAAGHLVGRLIRKRQGEYLVAGHSLRQEPCHAMRDHARLAASRPGQYQQRPLEMRHRFALRVGKFVEHRVSEESVSTIVHNITPFAETAKSAVHHNRLLLTQQHSAGYKARHPGDGPCRKTRYQGFLL